MNKIVLVWLCNVIVLSTFAQEAEFNRKHQLGVRVGQSIPLGIYEDNAVGFHADEGLAIGLYYQYELVQGLSATFEYMNLANQYNTETYDKSIKRQYNSNVFVHTETNPYRVNLYAAGLKLSFGNGPVEGYINPVFGTAKFISPEIKTEVVGQSNTSTVTISETDESKNLIILNAGAVYKATNKVFIGINIAYLNMGTFELNTNADYTQNGFKNGSQELEFFQIYSSLNSTVSIGFGF